MLILNQIRRSGKSVQLLRQAEKDKDSVILVLDRVMIGAVKLLAKKHKIKIHGITTFPNLKEFCVGREATHVYIDEGMTLLQCIIADMGGSLKMVTFSDPLKEMKMVEEGIYN